MSEFLEHEQMKDEVYDFLYNLGCSYIGKEDLRETRVYYARAHVDESLMVTIRAEERPKTIHYCPTKRKDRADRECTKCFNENKPQKVKPQESDFCKQRQREIEYQGNQK